jgi:tetratricopeptide (TPR) repeat protein/predicted phosphodiesterase
MTVSWLHISDFHFRGGDPYDRDVVLGALVNSMKAFRAKGRRPDLVFATGDVAYAGQANEYESATAFFDALLTAVGLERRQLFVVPGNHDVDRKLAAGLARTFESREQADTYFNNKVQKTHITQKQRNFVRWYNRYFKHIRVFPKNSTCGPVEVVDIRGLKIGILPLNSALFCEGDDDHEKLWIGRRCLDPAIKKLQEKGASLKVALMHHPLDWLNSLERANIKSALQSEVDFVLRGHLHETDADSVTGIGGQTLHLAAGATYQTRRYPNRAIYATIDRNRIKVLPIRFEDQPQEIWTVDPSIFPSERRYEKSFRIPRLTSPTPKPPDTSTEKQPQRIPVPPFRSNITSRRNLPFIGREDLLERVRESLRDLSRDAVLVLHGPPGVGKSELAREFARRQRERYPGGTFFVDAGSGEAPVDLARIGETTLELDFPPDLPIPDQCIRTLLTLADAPSLLIYDNVRSPESIVPWLPPAGMPCHVLITTVVGRWDPGWLTLAVGPLTLSQSRELIERLTDREVADQYGDRLAALAGGLPVQIVSASVTLAYEKRRGRLALAALTMARETEASFRVVYEKLEDPVRLLLHAVAFLNSQHILREELARQLITAANWSRADFERALDACLDLHLLDGTTQLRMHQLFASFVLANNPISAEIITTLAQVRLVQGRRMVELASDLVAHPNRAELAAALITFPLDPQTWEEAGAGISIEDGETVGNALSEFGQFQAALPWFQRAVAAKMKENIRGDVDHASLGLSLHQVGSCLSELGQFETARSWYERAATAKERGDVHGRIDYASLARSLSQVGACLSLAGQFDEARPWCERAVKAAKNGDDQGSVDHARLGESLHMVGFCLSETGELREAQFLYEQAVTEKKKGNIEGDVDHASLAKSVHQVGFCLSRAGEFDAAQRWFECAAAAAEKGDVHSRVDHASLGRSLHEAGSCLSDANQFGAALLWFQRAVAAKEKGDIHGRIDHESLGRTLQQIGRCVSSTSSQLETALTWFEQAVVSKEKGNVFGRVDHDSICLSLRAGADCCQKLGRLEEAKAWEEKASRFKLQ